MTDLTSVEICTGAGGQALGLERAGFSHEACVEIENAACETLRLNRPHWNVLERDLLGWSASDYSGVDLLAGGVPCPPFSHAGKQLGEKDKQNLFPKAIESSTRSARRQSCSRTSAGSSHGVRPLPPRRRAAADQARLQARLAALERE